jgi:WD40 repeat protein
MSNHDPEDKITVVSSHLISNHVALGTIKGNTYLINRHDGRLMNKFNPHEKKITGIILRENSQIITASDDGTIFI